MPYIDYSMSVNAALAYEEGEKPLSKWTKSVILAAVGEKAEILSPLNLNELRDLVLYRSSWHHTSKLYNRTDFYAVDEDKLEEVTEETVRQIIANRKPRETKRKEPPRTIHAEVTYTVWLGNYARYKRPKTVTETVTYLSGAKQIETSYGTKRLTSMTKIRELPENE